MTCRLGIDVGGTDGAGCESGPVAMEPVSAVREWDDIAGSDRRS